MKPVHAWTACLLICASSACTPPPKLRDDHASTQEDQSIVIDVLANDENADPERVGHFQPTSYPYGEVQRRPDGTVEFTPAPDFSGQASFTYGVGYDEYSFREATVTVDVSPDREWPEVTEVDLTALPAGLAAADFDRDGLTDIAVTTGAELTLLLQRRGAEGLPTFEVRESAPTMPGFSRDDVLRTYDLDRDGWLDVIAQDMGSHRARVFLNKPGLPFASAQFLGSPPDCAVDRQVVGDYDGNGTCDVVETCLGSDKQYLRSDLAMSAGAVTTATPILLTRTDRQARDILQGIDLTKDGKDELLGEGPHVFELVDDRLERSDAVSSGLGERPAAALDGDGDGVLDFVLGAGSKDAATILLSGAGYTGLMLPIPRFTSVVTGSFAQGRELVFADDEQLRFVALTPGQPATATTHGDLRIPRDASRRGFADVLLAADLNADGMDELVVANTTYTPDPQLGSKDQRGLLTIVWSRR
jgi:hypothetical protein